MAFASGFSVPSALANAPVDFWDIAIDGSTGGFGDLYQKNPWDTLFLGGLQIPGLCSVKAEPKVQFDKKKAPGLDGLTITAQGYIPGPVLIEIVIWTREQWDTWQSVRGKIWTTPKRGAKIPAIDISHPATRDAKIRAIVIEGISLPEQGPAPVSKSIKIRAVEFLEPNGKSAAHTINKSNAEMDPRQVPAPSAALRDKSPGVNQTGPTGLVSK